MARMIEASMQAVLTKDAAPVAHIPIATRERTQTDTAGPPPGEILCTGRPPPTAAGGGA